VGLVPHWVMIEGFEVLSHLISLLQAFPGAKRFVMWLISLSQASGVNGFVLGICANAMLR
jgi:hypothetical protein